MFRTLLNSSSKELNEIDSYSDASFGNSYRIIPLDEIEDLSDDVYPFTPNEYHIINSKEKFEKFNVVKRKYKEDDIRKKIKSSFHKYLRKIINDKLKKSDSIYLLESLPQNFIADISRKTNYEVMNLTYEQLFDYAYNQLITYAGKNHEGKKHIEKLKNTIKVSEKKCLKNKKALEYLSSNKVISEESGWERIKSMKYKDLLRAYLNSKEFQQYIKELSKKETKYYIDALIYFASTYIDFFFSYDPNENNNHRKNEPQSNSNIEDNNACDLNIPKSMVFPSTIFEITEDDNDLQGSLFFSWIDDDESPRENNLIKAEIYDLKQKINY